MRLVDREDFLKLPKGTPFQKNGLDNPLCIKGETILGDAVPIDFTYLSLDSTSNDMNSDHEFQEALQKTLETKEHIAWDKTCWCRDGLFDKDQLYIIYSTLDTMEMLSALASIVSVRPV